MFEKLSKQKKKKKDPVRRQTCVVKGHWGKKIRAGRYPFRGQTGGLRNRPESLRRLRSAPVKSVVNRMRP